GAGAARSALAAAGARPHHEAPSDWQVGLPVSWDAGPRGRAVLRGAFRRACRPPPVCGPAAIDARKRGNMRSNGSTDLPPAAPKAKTAPPPSRPRRGRRGVAETNGHDAVPSDQVDERKLLEVLTALRKGNFTPRLPVKWTGIAGRVADTVNDVMETNQRMARELERLARLVGKEGKITHRASVSEFSGLWAASIESVNTLVADLVHPTSEMARVIGAVAKGDLTQTMALDFDGRSLQGEFLRTSKTVNRMVE